MEGNFLNNPWINCCFVTTYAGVVAQYFKKGAEWFNFTTPSIGTFTNEQNEEDSSNYSTSGYDSSAETISANSSPINRSGVRSRISQKQRQRILKEAHFKAQQLNRKMVVQKSCPPDHEIKPVPSKFYQFDAITDFGFGGPVLLVGMQKDVEVMKLETKEKARSGRKKNRKSKYKCNMYKMTKLAQIVAKIPKKK